MIIHLDMDGVLADFDMGFYLKTSRTIDSFESTNAFWKFAGQYPDLYADLPVMKDAQVLVDYVVSLGHTVEVLTAVPLLTHMPQVPSHKEAWIERHFPYGWKFKIGPYSRDKQFHAKPGDVLIDDKQRNIDQWVAAGGIGILHVYADDSIKQLKQIFSQ